MITVFCIAAIMILGVICILVVMLYGQASTIKNLERSNRNEDDHYKYLQDYHREAELEINALSDQISAIREVLDGKEEEEEEEEEEEKEEKDRVTKDLIALRNFKQHLINQGLWDD